MMQTYIIYIFALVSAVVLTHTAEKTDKKKYILFAALILTLVAGLRNETVGIDAKKYAQYFSVIAQGQPHLAYGLEKSFVTICGILLKIWNNSNFLFTVYALVTNVLIIMRLWDFRRHISLPCAVAVYFSVFYFMTLNIVRQFVAIALVFFGTRYLPQKKYVKFVLFTMIAFLFHKSAIFGLAFIVCDTFAWKKLSEWQKKLLVIVFTAAPVIAAAGIYLALTDYSFYISNISFNLGLMLPLKLVFFGFTSLFIPNHGGECTSDSSIALKSYNFSMIKAYYVIGLLLTTLGYIFLFLDRIGIYFYIFETVYIGTVFKSKQTHLLIKIFVILLYAFILATALAGGGQGHCPYLFFWQM